MQPVSNSFYNHTRTFCSFVSDEMSENSQFKLNPAPTPSSYRSSIKKRNSKKVPNDDTENQTTNSQSVSEVISSLLQQEQAQMLSKVKPIPITEMYQEVPAQAFEPITAR